MLQCWSHNCSNIQRALTLATQKTETIGFFNRVTRRSNKGGTAAPSVLVGSSKNNGKPTAQFSGTWTPSSNNVSLRRRPTWHARCRRNWAVIVAEHRPTPYNAQQPRRPTGDVNSSPSPIIAPTSATHLSSYCLMPKKLLFTTTTTMKWELGWVNS